MAKLVSLLISARQQRVIAILLGVAIFAVLSGLSVFVTGMELRRAMMADSAFALDHFVRVRTHLDATFSELRERVTAAPCTPEFQNQLRRVAFLPDGFSEFLYAPNGVVACSLSIDRFDKPVALGKPDIEATAAAPSSLWIDRGLNFTGLGGLVGSIVMREPFAIVVPPQKLAMELPEWFELEVVLAGSDGRYWHRTGAVEIYDRYRIAQGPRASAFDPTLRMMLCDEPGRYCVATEATPAAVLAWGQTYFIVALIGLALLSAWLAARAKATIVRHWSFESRFRRHLDAGSVVCAYQPIVDVATGTVVGCEVLARWRDVDDSIVYPDSFIPLVEKYGLTEKFTRLVVERAHAELSAAIPADRRLKLTFNIFPRDLDSARLLKIFKVFEPSANRFDLVVELVESDQIVVEHAQRQIEALRAAGIRTYIDDFGTGYSNIQNLAALSVDGVKLDRAFAMAPDGSLMAKMLGHAIEMIHESGRAIVVEGVETAERLDFLRRLVPAIDYAQGYHICRPADVERFAAFLLADNRVPDRLELAA